MSGLERLSAPSGASRGSRRVGRGPGSGRGKTAGRGHKGRKARSGGQTRRTFEGGQTPLQRRLPKRGFRNIFRKVFQIVNVGELERHPGVEEFTPEVLAGLGLVRGPAPPIKLLGDGRLARRVTVRCHAASKGARAKVEAQGGVVEII